MTFEKDHTTAVVKSLDRFIVACNHDASFDHVSKATAENIDPRLNALKLTGREDLIIEGSVDRKENATNLWEHSLTPKKSKSNRPSHSSSLMSTKNVVDWMDTYPIRYESTHCGVSWIHRREKLSGSSLFWSLFMKQVDEHIVLGLGVTQFPQCFDSLLIVIQRICSADYMYFM